MTRCQHKSVYKVISHYFSGCHLLISQLNQNTCVTMETSFTLLISVLSNRCCFQKACLRTNQEHFQDVYHAKQKSQRLIIDPLHHSNQTGPLRKNKKYSKYLYTLQIRFVFSSVLHIFTASLNKDFNPKQTFSLKQIRDK